MNSEEILNNGLKLKLSIDVIYHYFGAIDYINLNFSALNTHKKYILPGKGVTNGSKFE